MKRPDWYIRFSRATEDWHTRHRKTIEIIVVTTMFLVTAALFLVAWLVGPNLVINGLLALAAEALMAAVLVGARQYGLDEYAVLGGGTFVHCCTSLFGSPPSVYAALPAQVRITNDFDFG